MSLRALFGRIFKRLSLRGSASGGSRIRPVLGLELLEDRLAPSASQYLLDFGTRASSVEAGFQPALKQAYSASRGYGWVNLGHTWLKAYDSQGSDALTRDGLRGQKSAKFRADLADGNYQVVATVGYPKGSIDKLTIVAEGQRVAEGIATAKGQFQRITFVTEVHDGKLDLQFSDKGGKNRYFAIAALEINPVTDTPPPAASAGPDRGGDEGTAVTFAGSATGSGLSYLWNFGDGTTLSGTPNPSHSYADNGVYTATLTVTDNLGRTASDSAQVVIDNTSPTATFMSDSSATAGRPTTFRFTNQTDASSTDAAEGFVYSFDFDNDGVFDVTDVRQTSASHTFEESGSYTVLGRITDKDGGWSDCTTVVDVAEMPMDAMSMDSSASVTVRAGLWSDPSIWNVPPTRDRDVVITYDVTIDSGEARRVDIMSGTTTLAGTLDAYGSVVVHSTLLGTQGQLLFHVANDRLFVGNVTPGPDPSDPDDHSDTDIGLWGMEGSTVKLIGPEVTPWLNALPKSTTGVPLGYGGVELAAIGGGTINLAAAPVGWQAGDTLLLTSVRGVYTLAKLLSVNGSTVTYQELKDNPSAADFSAGALLAEGRYMLPKVANLSRRLVIASADVHEGDTNHRAHTIFMHHSHVHLNYVEFRDLGPRRKLGRYPIHFHHAGHAEHSGGVIGSSIWQDVHEGGNRFITIHASQDVTIQNNVGLRSFGDGFFMEDGTEVNNKIIGNLSVDVSGAEELPVADAAMAPGAHHYWLRTGNVVEHNVAVGGSAIGMVLLPERNLDVTDASTVASDNEFYGMGQYGVWSRGVSTTQVRMVAAFCGQAGIGDGSWPDYSVTNLDDPTFFYNGLPGNVYASQIYINQGRDVQVKGGVLVGILAVHVHYASTFTIDGTTIRSKFLLDPTYWELGGEIRASDIQVDTLFKSVYGIRREAPGLLRIEGAVGRVGTVSYSASRPLTADFTHANAINVKSFAGTNLGNGARQLAAPAPMSGFLRPPSLPRNSSWSVVPSGAATSSFLYLSENESSWEKNSASLGYFDGFPPGTYDVTIKTTDGRTFVYRSVSVQSGQVTDLSTYPVEVRISSELSWLYPMRLQVSADGSFTVDRSYLIQGTSAEENITITYYYSTDPWGKSGVTQLGSETVTAADGKTVGTHTGTSPRFRIPTSGTYYVFARIDTSNVIEENDETNNVSGFFKIVI